MSPGGSVQVKATFRIMGASLNPDKVSTLLGISPDDSHRRGDPRRNKAGVAQYAPFSEGIWQLYSCEKSTDVEAHLTEIINRFKGKDRALLELQAMGCRIDIFLGLIGIDGNYGFSVSRRSLEALSQLGVSIGFDVYTKGNEKGTGPCHSDMP